MKSETQKTRSGHYYRTLGGGLDSAITEFKLASVVQL